MKTKGEFRNKSKCGKDQNFFKPMARTMIYTDRQNLEIHFSKIRCPGDHIDYHRLFRCLSEGNELVGSKIFDSVKSEDDPKNGILDYYSSCGYSVFKRICSHEQKGVDIEMALNLMKDADNDLYDTAVLISGDGDFVPAVEYAKSRGKEIVIASYKDSLSRNLCKAADSIVVLDNQSILKVGSTEKKIREALPMTQHKPRGRNYQKMRAEEIERLNRRYLCREQIDCY